MDRLFRHCDACASSPTRSRSRSSTGGVAWLLGARIVALALAVGLAGCGRGEGSDQGSQLPEATPVQDTTGEGGTPAEGIAAGVTIPAASPGEAPETLASALPSGDSVAESAPPAQDTAAAGDIQRRLERLEAENDSLRSAVTALLVARAREETGSATRVTGPASQEAAADSSRLPSDLIDVDAQDVQNWGLRIAVSVVFLLLTGLFIRILIWVLEKLAERNAKRRLLIKRIVPIARISIWFLAILFASMIILHVNAQGLIAAGAAVGVAVGFAAQDILKNIFGGLIVLFDQPFQVGDKISVEGTYGEVVSIGLRSTRIVTPDDNLVSVPNSQVVDGQVANANAGELNCQVVTDLYLPGWVDEARAKRIAFEAAASSRYVFLNKAIVVLVKDEFKETFLTHLKVKAYVLDPRYEFLFMSDVTERARAGFRKAGLLGPMHGVRAYVDLDGLPRPAAEAPREGVDGLPRPAAEPAREEVDE